MHMQSPASTLPGATTYDDNAMEAISTAHARSLDAVQGFRTMVEKAEVEFKPVAERFLSLHERHAAALANLLTSAGHSPDASGSFMGKVNELVVSARALFDEIDEDVMDQIRGGEEHILGALSEAAAATSGETSAAISGMREELQTLLAETSDLD
ncbi:MAG: DUF2383 domain-containing protein [Pseudomonadota bacterium]